MSRIAFPIGSVGKLFGPNAMPGHLRPHHGAIISITGRPREPSLRINQSSHAIIKVLAGEPAAGWGTVQGAVDAVPEGGSIWFCLSSLGEAIDFARTYLARSNISLSYQN